jgi:hypothetical protein
MAFGVNTLREWIKQLCAAIVFDVPAEGIESIYAPHHNNINRMAMNGVAPAESMAFAHHKPIAAHTVYQEMNKRT